MLLVNWLKRFWTSQIPAPRRKLRKKRRPARATETLEVRVLLVAPVLTANALAVSENASVVLSSANLNATDADGDPLTYTVSSVVRGRFEFVSAAGTPITTFSQTDVTSGNVRFVDDGSELAPSYSVSVSDGVNATAPAAAAITFTNVNDQDPVLSNNQLSVAEGATVLLSTANLDATDGDLPGDTLIFTVSNVTRGRFELVSNPGTAVTTFSRTGLVMGNVRFVHDGSEFAPTYSVSVSDGRVATAAAAATVTFSNVNDQAPVLTANSLSVAEGATVVLTTAHLNATDADLPGDTLTFNVTGVTRGQFEMTTAPGVAITGFSRAALVAGMVQFVHDGSELAPSYSVSVSDGVNTTTAATATITFTNVNDQTPIVTVNALTLSEGASVVLTTSNLNATDADLPGDTLSFAVSNLSNGRFELTSAAGTAITSFTRANLVAGVVRFVHNGGEAAPTYSIAATDGTNTSAPVSATITFTNVNDPPVLTANTLTLAEGATVLLTTANLETSDPDLPGDTLTYTVSGVTRGQFELTTAPGNAVTSFTRANVVANQVRFVHDGSEFAPTYSVSVSDGTVATTAAAATITFTNVNDQTPVLTANALTISEGATVTITTSILNATDGDLPGDTLTFSVSGVSNGQFELSTAVGTPVTTFTRANVVAGIVRFVHDGSENAPAYSVSVSDGVNTSANMAATIMFNNVNDAPVLTANALSVTEGGTVLLSAVNLEATDADTAQTSLTYTVSNVTRGRFELVSNAGTAVTSFSRANLVGGNVQFVHDGSEFAPTYSVSVSDGQIATPAAAATITFANVNDQAPVLTVNTLAISEGGTVVLTTARLNATDADLPGDSLSFTVSNVANGRFELTSAPGVPVTTFSKAALTAGTVQFVHDGSEFAPSYSVSVSDGANSTTPAAATITFTNVNDQNPSLTVNSLVLDENATVTLSTANFDAADADLPGDTLTFTVSNVTRGRFAFSTAIGIAVTSFTKANLTAGIVRFVHDGSEFAPTFDVSVSDGLHPTTPVAGNVTFTNVNDQTPVLTANALTITEGGTVILSTANVNATDADLPGDVLSFNVTNVTRGQFELTSAAGIPITSFSLANLMAGVVQFVHDGSELAPTYSVSATDGTRSSTAAAATVTFANVNDQMPVLSVNNLPITEGGTLTLTTAHLNVTDGDLPGDPLSFTVGSVTNGRFELSGNPGTAVTTFTRANVVAGVVRFVHDGSETAPTFTVSVSDGTNVTPAVAGGVTFTNVNDQTPVLTANSLSIAEGATVLLSPANFNATDADLPGDTLTFNVTGLTRGRFELVSAAGTAVTSFSLANLTGGNVQFVHDGSEFAPTFNISVSDGARSTTAAATTITFANVNDQTPVVTANALSIGEGATVVLTTANLNATDADLPGDTLSFTVSNVTRGQFEFTTNPGVAITTFSRAALVAGTVRFVHDGSEFAPTYSVSAGDGTNDSTAAPATITFTNVNDQNPVLTVNNLVVAENATVTVTTAHFDATDADFPGDTLTFTVSNVTRGRFAFSTALGTAITSFTRQNLVAGIVRFVHDSSEFAPTFDVSVSDGLHPTAPVAGVVTFTNVNDQTPIFTARNLTVVENGTVVLTTANLNATDADLPGDTLSFVVSNVTRGRFEYLANQGVAITTFTRSEVDGGLVQFVHDSSEFAPTFSVAATDGLLTSAAAAATITFTNVNDQMPVLTANTLTITEGATVTLTTANLNATDADLPGDTLTFTVSNVTGGRFELTTAPGTAVSGFSRADVVAGRVRFVHDGNEPAPTYSVSVSDGPNTTTPAVATVIYTNVNDQVPVLTVNALTLQEGATVTLQTTDLDATDADLPGDTLTFLVSNVTRGRFELASAAGTAITSFSRANLVAGAVRFVHDGGEFAPTYRVAVNDGVRTTAAADAVITFTNVNDAPLLTKNALTIAEGGSVVLSTGNFNATDADLPGDLLTFNVTELTGGRFELVTAAGAAITSFTLANVAQGKVRFVHDGGEAAPAFKVAVTDGTVETTPASTAVTFTNVNDQPPVLTANSLTINEGQTVTLTTNDLDATDGDLPGDTLVFTVSAVTRGRFELATSPGTAIGSFTRAALVAGNVRFVHDGGEAVPSYNVSVSDGSFPTPAAAAAVTFTNLNDAPTLTARRITVSEGGTQLLSTANFNATDADLPGDVLAFSVTSVANGRFEYVFNPGTAITSFTLDDVVAGSVAFVHDGSEAAPAFNVTVTDGLAFTSPLPGQVTFTNVNDAPTLIASNLSVTEGGTSVVSTANIDATDPDLPGDPLTFTVSGVTRGRFELSTSPGTTVTRFSRTDLVAGRVRFVHDGSEFAPTFNVSVSDGRVATPETAGSVTFANVNDPPLLTANAFAIAEGATLVLTTSNLNATDADLTGDTLTFVVTNVARGRFENAAAPGVAITSFALADVVAGNVRFVHDGGEAAPAWSIAVTDGTVTTAPVAASISFTNVNDVPVLSANAFTVSEGGTVSLSGANFNATDGDPNDVLTFYVSNVTRGRFVLASAPGTTITSFSRTALVTGNVRFIHDGSEFAPTVFVAVSDGTTTTTPAATAVTYMPVNDPPTLTASRLTVVEGGTVAITTDNFNATDLDLPGDTLTFTVTSLSRGQFELTTAPGSAVAAFTKAQVVAGLVRFVHDGSELAPAFKVAVSDGTVTTAAVQVTINFTNVNDLPTLTANALTISEGQSVILSLANLNATDPDSQATALQFTVSSVTRGRFELVSSPGNAVTTFSRSAVAAGNVRFVHDGSEFAPTFNVAVSDGQIGTSPAAATVTFTNVNDPPVVLSTTLSISENDSAAPLVSVSDPDTPVDGIWLIPEGVTHGQFEDVNVPGVALSTFQLSEVLLGNVAFVHDGSEFAPTYSLRATDGIAFSAARAGVVTFLNVNDEAPVITVNTLTVTEGGMTTLTAALLNATDPDLPLTTAITYLVSGVQSGRFELSSRPGMAITTFTKSDVAAQRVRFVHDGSDDLPAYTVIATDGTFFSDAVAVNATLNRVNDPPAITFARMSLREGDTVVLSVSPPSDPLDLPWAQLFAADPDLPGDVLRFTVSSVTRGRFERSTAQGVAITTFTQAEVMSGIIQFVHDGGEVAPTFRVAVFDGTVTTTAVNATITFANVSDPPTLATPVLKISEGGTVTLSTANLNATDPDLPANTLTFTISNPTHGRFVLSAVPGTEIREFTKAQLSAGQVKFIHDGSEFAPSFDVSVSDGTTSTPTVSADVTFTNVNDQIPVITANALVVEQGGFVVLTTAELNATDDDLPANTLTFSVSNVTRGKFERVTAPGKAITSFTLAELVAGNVRFKHDGSEFAPTYRVVVSDGARATAAINGNVTFVNLNDPPVLTVRKLTLSNGAAVTVTTLNLMATDTDVPADVLSFDVSGVEHGRFEVSGVATTTFRLADVQGRRVRFVHDGSGLAPSFLVSVSDGKVSTTPVAATIAFGRAPSVSNVSIYGVSVRIGAAPVLLMPTVLVSDADTPVFNGGTLTIGFPNNADAGDRFQVLHQGDGPNQVGVTDDEIRFGNVVVGTSTGGNGAPLVITFNSAATILAVQSVMRRIAFGSVATGPRAARTAEIVVTDGNGGTSNVIKKPITVTN